jgi:hypothetical protein
MESSKFRKIVLKTIASAYLVDHVNMVRSKCNRISIHIYGDTRKDFNAGKDITSKLFDYNNDCTFYITANIDFDIDEERVIIFLYENIDCKNCINCHNFNCYDNEITCKNFHLYTANIF